MINWWKERTPKRKNVKCIVTKFIWFQINNTFMRNLPKILRVCYIITNFQLHHCFHSGFYRAKVKLLFLQSGLWIVSSRISEFYELTSLGFFFFFEKRGLLYYFSKEQDEKLCRRVCIFKQEYLLVKINLQTFSGIK